MAMPLGDASHRPDPLRVLHAGDAADALTDRPAVVEAWFDQVQLVRGAGAELRLPQPALRVPGDPLGVAVAVAVDAGTERVARRRRSGLGDPQDLAVERGKVLGKVLLLRVTGGGVQETVGAERDPAATAGPCPGP